MAIILVLATGFFEIQIMGLSQGGVYGLDNTLVGVKSPETPVLQISALASINVLALVSVVGIIARGSQALRWSFAVVFLVVVSTLIVWSYLIPNAIEHELNLGVQPGWLGWIQWGGSSPAVHVTLLAVVVFSWLLFRILAGQDSLGRAKSQVPVHDGEG
ncbi:hypothetical protein ACPYO6_02895 [Georgenia sp. Z1344]|uniref:hypothetical protein n=1 Tax=Georgenia sp. Z1344 TaxID=3416706 RepID=UPI003CE9F673